MTHSNAFMISLSQFKITFNGNNREFWFRASNRDEAASWVNTINLHIRASKGFKEQAMAPKTAEFWRQEQISEKQFIDMADTFDILLFKCNTSGGKIIRTYTGSEFGKLPHTSLRLIVCD